MIQYAGRTHPGHKRGHNEDCYEADAGTGLWLVADGVGGHSNGEVAAAITCRTVRSDLEQGTDLVAAIQHAHRSILEEIHARGAGNNMGSTVVALRLDGRYYEVAWIGDSRAYLFDGELRQLTRDHSAVGEMLASGSITRREAARHPQRHILSQSLGIADSVALHPGRIDGALQPGQQILLCTDGLTDELSDRRIADVLRGHSDVDGQAEALLQAALAAGGSDNITVVIVGEPGRAGRRRPARADLETTQDIGEAIGDSSASPRSHTGKVWLVVALIAALAVWWLSR